jgi:hypothetical protein
MRRFFSKYRRTIRNTPGATFIALQEIQVITVYRRRGVNFNMGTPAFPNNPLERFLLPNSASIPKLKIGEKPFSFSGNNLSIVKPTSAKLKLLFLKYRFQMRLGFQ